MAQMIKAHSAGDPSLIPGLGRSPGEEIVNPVQYSGLESPMGRGAWRATVHGVAESQTRLSETVCTHTHVRVSLMKSLKDYRIFTFIISAEKFC